MNKIMSSILIHNITDCHQLCLTYLIELEKRKRIRHHHMEFGRNFVYECTITARLHLCTNDTNFPFMEMKSEICGLSIIITGKLNGLGTVTGLWFLCYYYKKKMEWGSDWPMVS